jgi:hypothetical protein
MALIFKRQVEKKPWKHKHFQSQDGEWRTEITWHGNQLTRHRSVRPVSPRLVPFITGTEACSLVDRVWNVTAHAQKPDFVFRRNGRVHLNRRGASGSVDYWQPRCAHQR